ncbi:MAG: glycosyltransferase family 4 protein [Pseudobacter sp.]|uniref:glycosyltransferase family 4 protein n=1 Tax=Pseudobacter sp. TaxID=2045420 RepID=UPI003F81348D
MQASQSTEKRPAVFTWHIHGSYLYYLSQADIDIYVPLAHPVREGYYGRGQTFPFGSNVKEVPVEQVKELDFDCILFQSPHNFLRDQYEILSEAQRAIPKIYLEHNAPNGAAASSVHPMNDPFVTLVHVTHYNKLMWDQTVPDVRVIEHGIIESPWPYTGELEKGIVVINHIRERGRDTGWDIYEQLKEVIPLDLAGMGTEIYGGLGEILHPQLPQFLSRYRFFLNPIRHTSLGLSFLEAMMGGLPVVALATTEYATVIRNGYTGFVHTNISELIEGMQLLLENRDLAAVMGRHAQRTAKHKYNITRFAKDWEHLIRSVASFQIQTHETESSIH